MRVFSRFSIAFVLSFVVTAAPVFGADDVKGTAPSARPFEGLIFGSSHAGRPAPADVNAPVRTVNPVAGTVMSAESLAAKGLVAEAASGDAAQPFAGRAIAPGRPKALPALYVSLAALQVMDVVSTSKGLSVGAVEANPVMAPVVKNKAAFVAVKAGTTAVSIYLAERLWKKNRVAAIATMVGINAMMGVVVAHNQAVVAKLR